ncbi:hypothetical protein PQX77_002006 [Marasmius sp. AFHP31]|nr:hypothetical protein PQX77_002006 [Marasmius sp. AFHP31]
MDTKPLISANEEPCTACVKNQETINDLKDHVNAKTREIQELELKNQSLKMELIDLHQKHRAQDSEIMRLLRVVREREAQQKVVDEANRSLATDISEPEYSNHPILPLTGTDLEQLTDSNSVLRGTAQNIASVALRNKQGNVANITPFLLSFTSAIQSEVMKLNRRASSAALQEGLGEIHQKAETLSLLLQRAQAASRAALLPQNDSPGTATEADVFSAILSHAKGDFPSLETFLDLAR